MEDNRGKQEFWYNLEKRKKSSHNRWLWTEGWDFFRLYYHIVLCTDLFLTSHEDGNFWQICRLFEVFWDAN